jgi:hypothetical protein
MVGYPTTMWCAENLEFILMIARVVRTRAFLSSNKHFLLHRAAVLPTNTTPMSTSPDTSPNTVPKTPAKSAAKPDDARYGWY